MKKVVILFLFVTSIIQAQYSVKGTIIPAKKYNWVILYKLEGVHQVFVKRANIKLKTISQHGIKTSVGKFEFTLPVNAKSGVYRLVYKLKVDSYIDFFFNKENVEFTFNPEFPQESVVYTKSKENKLYIKYLQTTATVQQSIDSLQGTYLEKPSKEISAKYRKALNKMNDIEKKYGDLSKNMLINPFIKASYHFNSFEIIDNPQQYFNSIDNHFFDFINFKSKALYNSSFLVDKITDYIFYLNYSNEKTIQQELYKKSIAKVIQKITDLKLKKEILKFIINEFSKTKNVKIVDYIFSNYYNKISTNLEDEKFRKKILNSLVAEIGTIAPDFSWKENKKNYKLSTLKDGKNYLLIFWSSTCSHCLKEIPLVYQYMKNNPNTKVVAFSLETNKYGWQRYIDKLKGWHHILGLKKWENPIAIKYKIYETPSYFLLSSDKKIVAKPYDLNEIKKYFANHEQ